MNTQVKATFLMISVSTLWGLSYTFMKMGLESLPPMNIVALRFLIAFIVAGLVFYKRCIKITLKEMRASIILGALLFGVFTFITIGVNLTTASNAGFLVSLAVLFVPLILAVTAKRLPSKMIVISLIITLVGISLLTLKSPLGINPGDLLCIIGALFYAFHIIFTDKFTQQYEPIRLGIFQLGVAGTLGLIASLIFEKPGLPANQNAWFAILGLGIVCSAYGFIGQALAQKHISPTLTGLIHALEPVTTAIFAVLLLNESFSLKDLFGCLLVLLGIIVAQINQDSKLIIEKKM